jgi:hypothetical protein
MQQAPPITPLLDRINAALRERGLDPDDPFAGDDARWAPEDHEQVDGDAVPGLAFRTIAGATGLLALGSLAFAIYNLLAAI